MNPPILLSIILPLLLETAVDQSAGLGGIGQPGGKDAQTLEVVRADGGTRLDLHRNHIRAALDQQIDLVALGIAPEGEFRERPYLTVASGRVGSDPAELDDM